MKSRVLVFVDEANVVSSVRALGRKLDWLELRDFLTRADEDRRLIEMVIYAGLPPPMPEWQGEREKKHKFLHWLRTNGFLVVAKEGSPGDGRHYKANVDVLMAIDAVELSVEMRPDVVVLVRVACSPKFDPGAMRVGGAKAPANSHHETQKT